MTAFVVAILVLAIDQVTKLLAVSGVIRASWIDPGLNPDLALGVLGGPSGVEIAGAAIALLVATRVLRRARPGTGNAIATGLVVGGSLGNLADRIASGAVRDFLIAPKVLFNLADVALVVGLVTLCALWARDARRLSDR